MQLETSSKLETSIFESILLPSCHAGYDLYVLGLQEANHSSPVDLTGQPLWGTSNDYAWLAAFTRHLHRSYVRVTCIAMREIKLVSLFAPLHLLRLVSVYLTCLFPVFCAHLLGCVRPRVEATFAWKH